jgi:protein-disulfide isomerase
MRVTRRQAAYGAAAVLLFGGATSPLWYGPLRDAAFGADLMRAGPLGEQALGQDDAPVTIIEYASMTCPHCANFHRQVWPALKERYVDAGKVRFILREFPLDALGAAAFTLARCLDRDGYFPFVDMLFRQQAVWLVDEPIEPLRTLAGPFGFTREKFDTCLADQSVLDGILWVRDRAARHFGVAATPTFFIGGKRHAGEISIAELERAIGRAGLP